MKNIIISIYKKLKYRCSHDFKTYSYTTKTVIEDNEEVVKYDKQRQQCRICSKWRTIQ